MMNFFFFFVYDGVLEIYDCVFCVEGGWIICESGKYVFVRCNDVFLNVGCFIFVMFEIRNYV